MTIYIKQLLKQLLEKYGEMTVEEFARKIFELGVIDHRQCKVLAVREWVAATVKNGTKKTDAMWAAAEHFSCTYEYIRKCMYYYTDVNFD